MSNLPPNTPPVRSPSSWLITELRSALSRYGEHGSACETWIPKDGKCDCGLAKALVLAKCDAPGEGT